MNELLDSFDLSGSVALVTGAGRGLGEATCRVLAAAGAMVAVTGRRQADLERTCGAVAALGGEARPYVMDVTDAESVECVIAEAREAWGELHILVNNAGVAHQESAVTTSQDDWTRVIDTNLAGTFICSKTFARGVNDDKPRTIINLSSIGATAGVRGQAAYCASKAGVEGLTRTLAIEFAAMRIRVNALAPGYVLTDMPRQVAEDPARAEQVLRKIPMRRFAEVDEIGGAILFLASNASSYMTGATLHVDGGYTAQ